MKEDLAFEFNLLHRSILTFLPNWYFFTPPTFIYTHHKFNNQTRYDDPTNQNPTLWERRVPELGDERKGWGRATNHWAQISFPRIPCQCISQKQIFRFPIIKAMNCTIDWFLLPLTLFRPDLPRPHPAHLHKESFKDVCTTYKQTHTFSKSKLCTATYIPFLDGVASDPPTIQLTQDTAWVNSVRTSDVNWRWLTTGIKYENRGI